MLQESANPDTSPSLTGRFSRVGSLARAASHAAGSVAKTGLLRRDRVTDEQYRERLDTCRNCPGGHATFKGSGESRRLHTCGPMVESMASASDEDGSPRPCGCVLTKKARDVREDCPFGYWPTIESEAIEEAGANDTPQPVSPAVAALPSAGAATLLTPDKTLVVPERRRGGCRSCGGGKKKHHRREPSGNRVITPTEHRGLVTFGARKRPVRAGSTSGGSSGSGSVVLDRRSFMGRSLAAMTALGLSYPAWGSSPQDDTRYVPVDACESGQGTHVACADVEGRSPGEVFTGTDGECYTLSEGKSVLGKELGANAVVVTPDEWFDCGPCCCMPPICDPDSSVTITFSGLTPCGCVFVLNSEINHGYSVYESVLDSGLNGNYSLSYERQCVYVAEVSTYQIGSFTNSACDTQANSGTRTQLISARYDASAGGFTWVHATTARYTEPEAFSYAGPAIPLGSPIPNQLTCAPVTIAPYDDPDHSGGTATITLG